MNNKTKDDCTGCKYSGLSPNQSPCFRCCNNYENQWTKKDIKKEFTEEELRNIFEDKYVGRRAIGIEEINALIEELFT